MKIDDIYPQTPEHKKAVEKYSKFVYFTPIHSQEEYDKLAAGSHYVDSHGNKAIKITEEGHEKINALIKL